MSKELTLYDVSRMLKEAGFEQPNYLPGQLWWTDYLECPIRIMQYLPEYGLYHHYEGSSVARLSDLPHDAFYQPTIEDIMLRLPPTACLRHTYAEDDADVLWWLCSPNMHKVDPHFVKTGFYKHPVIACGMAWLYFHSKKADHGKVDTE